jgi:predicted aspartyl protease
MAHGKIRTEKPAISQRAKIASLVLMLSAVASQQSLAADAPKCGLTRYTSLPITTLSDGRIAVPVTVEGLLRSFMVDTGGVSATMSARLAKDSGKKPKATNRWLSGLAGSMMTSFVDVDFALGPLTGKQLAVYIDPRTEGMGVDGTLAPDMMHQFDVDLDFAGGVMNLISQDHCPGQVVYWTKAGYIAIPMSLATNGHIRVPVMVDGKQANAILDTGSAISIVSMSLAESLGIKADDSLLKLKSSFGLNGRYKEYSYPFKTLSLDGLTVNNPHIIVESDATMGRLGSDIILGMGILRQLHLYVAYKEQKLYITPASAN